MKENRKEELLIRWMDGGMSEAERLELEPYLEEHPELEAEREAFLAMRKELRTAVPASVEPPYPDFFNAHLERMIREMRSGSGGEARRARGPWGMLRWFWAPAAAAALGLAFLAGVRIGGPQEEALVVSPEPVTPAVYSPIVSVQVEAVRDEMVGGTVIVLDGLEEIPHSVDLFQASVPGRAPERYTISTGMLY